MNDKLVRVLLVEDDEDDYILIKDWLSTAPFSAYDLHWVDTPDAALEALRSGGHDVCLLDYRLGEYDGLEILRRAAGNVSKAPIILLTGHENHMVDLEAMKAGAVDYLVKGQINADLLKRSIRYAMENQRARNALQKAHDELEMKVEERTSELRTTNDLLTREIEERIRVEEALRESEEKYRTLYETMEQGVIYYNAKGEVISANPAALRILGASEEEIGERPFAAAGWRAIHENGSPFRGDEFPARLAMETGEKILNVTIGIFTPREGGHRWINVSSIPQFRPGEGRPYLVYTTFTDITAVKKAQDALQEAHDELEARIRERTAELFLAYEEIKVSEKRLRALSSRLISVQEEERKRISRELHDSIGASLSAIKFSLENICNGTQEHTPLNDSLQTIISMAQNTMDDVRRIMADLRPSMLDDLGILPTIGWFTRRFQSVYSDIHVEREIGVEEEDIPEPVKIVVFRILQEALHNVAKHSRANLVHVLLAKAQDAIELAITDNGVGFDPRSTSQKKESTACASGLGLASMKERTELSGGSFAIESSVGKGTVIRASWPC